MTILSRLFGASQPADLEDEEEWVEELYPYRVHFFDADDREIAFEDVMGPAECRKADPLIDARAVELGAVSWEPASIDEVPW